MEIEKRQDVVTAQSTGHTKRTMQLFLGVVFLLVGMFAVYFNYDVFGKGVFSTSVELIDPLNYYAKNNNTYIINNSGLEIMVLEDRKYQYSLTGGCIEDGFYYARDVKVDQNGNIYVLDKQLNENGKSVDAERIIQYDAEGNFIGILYSHPHEDGKSVLQIYNLMVEDGEVSFVCTSPDDTFSVCKVLSDSEGVLDTRTYSYENSYEVAWDFAFDEEENVYISSKTGVIEKIDGQTGERTVLYDASSNQNNLFDIIASLGGTGSPIQLSQKGNRDSQGATSDSANRSVNGQTSIQADAFVTPAGDAYGANKTVRFDHICNRKIQNWSAEVNISSLIDTVKTFDRQIGDKGILYVTSSNPSDYFSIPTSIEYGSDGAIYFNDIGHRVIRKLYPDGTLKTVVGLAEPIEEPPEAFSEQPIYSGLFVSEDLSVATFYSHSYFYETEDGEGEQVYEYKLFEKSNDGTHLLNDSVFMKSRNLTVRGMLIAAVAAAVVVGLIIMMSKAIRTIFKANISGTVKTQLVIILTAVLTASISIYIIVSETNKVYYDEVMSNLENVGMLLAQNIDEEDLNRINTPDDFMNENYQNISDTVLSVLDYGINSERGLYCVIYKAQNDIVSVVYADDGMYGSGYPMPGSLEGSGEQMIYETGESVSVASHSSSEGNFMFVLGPIFNEDEEVIGLIEIGTDLYSINENTKKQVVDTILLVMTAVMVGVLLISELIVIRANMRKRSLSQDHNMPLDSGLIRPIVFLFFFISNMPTAFLPVFAGSLWTEDFFAPVEVATALPVSTELFVTAVMSVLLGFAVSKIGVKLMTILGTALIALGNILCAFAPDLFQLLLASAVTGTGNGLIVLAINSYIAGYDDDDQKNEGFMHYNAALLSGVNCGTVIGSMIAERFNYSMTYLTAMGICAILVVFCMICIRNHSDSVAEESASEKTNVLQFLCKPNVLKYFLLISAPYLICAAFLNYFFPIFGEENGLTPTQISLAFLLMGLISIYFGPGLTKLLSEQLGAKKSMLLATGLYAMALIIFIVRPQISTCYVAVVLFAFADSFGFTMQSVHYSTLPETVAVGEGPAMGINSGVESAASTAGPLIFGTMMMAGTVMGITIIAAGFIALALLFVVTSYKTGKK